MKSVLKMIPSFAACSLFSVLFLANPVRAAEEFYCGNLVRVSNVNKGGNLSTSLTFDVKSTSEAGTVTYILPLPEGKYESLLTKALANPQIEVCARSYATKDGNTIQVLEFNAK